VNYLVRNNLMRRGALIIGEKVSEARGKGESENGAAKAEGRGTTDL